MDNSSDESGEMICSLIYDFNTLFWTVESNWLDRFFKTMA